MFYVYILKSLISGMYYIGSTGNINKRLKQHNRKLVQSTKKHAPWRMSYFEEHADLSAARQRELQIKSWKKRVAIERLINNAGL